MDIQPILLELDCSSSLKLSEAAAASVEMKNVSTKVATASHVLQCPLERMGSGESIVLDDEEHDAPLVSDITESIRMLKLPSSRYKGVVSQPNGRWGAQIYEKHRRVWLGTFNSETEAARAYDVAAWRFRGGDAVTNFKQAADEAELEFVASRSKTEIVDMLRKRTYHDELSRSRRACGTHKRKSADNDGGSGGWTDREVLFEKAVTPSDVGKLNRLVIPKQHAEKHFPLKGGSLLLSFQDVNNGKLWRFRYSYWNSSQSYVLTKGWSRFVREKGLKIGDSVVFQKSTGPEKQTYIECKPKMKATLLPVRMIRLFGVNISEVEVLLMHKLVKKQCVRDL